VASRMAVRLSDACEIFKVQPELGHSAYMGMGEPSIAPSTPVIEILEESRTWTIVSKFVYTSAGPERHQMKKAFVSLSPLCERRNPSADQCTGLRN